MLYEASPICKTVRSANSQLTHTHTHTHTHKHSRAQTPPPPQHTHINVLIDGLSSGLCVCVCGVCGGGVGGGGIVNGDARYYITPMRHWNVQQNTLLHTGSSWEATPSPSPILVSLSITGFERGPQGFQAKTQVCSNWTLNEDLKQRHKLAVPGL